MPGFTRPLLAQSINGGLSPFVGVKSLLYISNKTTRVVKTCPPCMFNELEDRKSYENNVIDLRKKAL